MADVAGTMGAFIKRCCEGMNSPRGPARSFLQICTSSSVKGNGSITVSLELLSPVFRVGQSVPALRLERLRIFMEARPSAPSWVSRSSRRHELGTRIGGFVAMQLGAKQWPRVLFKNGLAHFSGGATSDLAQQSFWDWRSVQKNAKITPSGLGLAFNAQQELLLFDTSLQELVTSSLRFLGLRACFRTSPARLD